MTVPCGGSAPHHRPAARRPDHTGQTALHWAAVRGAVGAAEALLRGGAAPGARDGHGYTVAHVAAQYGQTAFLHRLALRWGIDVDWRAPRLHLPGAASRADRGASPGWAASFEARGRRSREARPGTCGSARADSAAAERLRA